MTRSRRTAAEGIFLDHATARRGSWQTRDTESENVPLRLPGTSGLLAHWAGMPRYYFNVRKGDRPIPDIEGQELVSIENAWAEAAGSIGDMVKDTFLSSSRVRFQMAIEVCEDDRPVLLVKVSLAPA